MILIIILGTRGVTSLMEKGEFFCPSCDARRPYDHKRVRRFFTLYFLPIIPLDVVGEYVECQVCQGTYKPGVLGYDPDAEAEAIPEAEFHAAVKRVMVLMMMADGHIADEEVETIRQVFGKLANREIARAEVDAEIAATKIDGRGLRQYLAAVCPQLNEVGKDIVLKAAFFVAAADGEVTNEEKALLSELAAALEITPEQFRGVVEELTR
jgi:tellurite resistance protein